MILLGIVLLAKVLNNPVFFRTRDPEVLKTCDIVVDVGGVYDHSAKRYDHHQKLVFIIIVRTVFFREFTDNMQTLNILPFNTKLSSAGLVYAHYGQKLISTVFH